MCVYVYLFIRIFLTHNQTFLQVNPKADKAEFTAEHYFARAVLKHFMYPRQTFLYRGGLQRCLFEQVMCFSEVGVCFSGFLELLNALGVRNMPGCIISTPCF